MPQLVNEAHNGGQGSTKHPPLRPQEQDSLVAIQSSVVQRGVSSTVNAVHVWPPPDAARQKTDREHLGQGKGRASTALTPRCVNTPDSCVQGQSHGAEGSVCQHMESLLCFTSPPALQSELPHILQPYTGLAKSIFRGTCVYLTEPQETALTHC